MKGVRGEKGVGEKGNGRETEQVGVKMRRGLGTDARSCRSARWASARASCWLLLRGVSGEGCKHVTPPFQLSGWDPPCCRLTEGAKLEAGRTAGL